MRLIAPKLSLFEIWCLLALASLPLIQITQVNIGGVYIGVVELLVPVQLAVLFVFLFNPNFHLPLSQVRVIGVFAVLLCYELLVSVSIHHNPSLMTLKIVVGQSFVMLTFIFFCRVPRHRVPFFVELLVLVATLVTVVTIAVNGFSGFVRMDSPFWGRTNAFAAVLVPTTLGSIACFLIWRRQRMLIYVVICFMGLLLTQSRGGLLSFMFGFGLMMSVYVSKRQRLILLLVSPVLMLSIFLMINSGTIRSSIPVLERMYTDFQYIQEFMFSGSEEAQRQVMSGRLYYWGSALSSIARNPVYGTNEFQLYIPQWAGSAVTQSEDTVFAYHNWLLSITARWGIIGLVLNLLFLVVALSPYFRHLQSRKVQVWGCVLIVVVIHGLAEPIFELGFSVFNLVTIIFWIFVSLGYHLWNDDNHRRRILPTKSS